jgi:hypothetical protein
MPVTLGMVGGTRLFICVVVMLGIVATPGADKLVGVDTGGIMLWGGGCAKLPGL